MKSPKTEEGQVALNKGRCPECGVRYVDLRGSNSSQHTLRGYGDCCGDGNSYECNKDVRDQKNAEAKAKAALWNH